jgi:ankyrin repeat protein
MRKNHNRAPNVFLAVQGRDLSGLEKLLVGGADANEGDSEGMTPLMEAAITGQEEVVDLLLANGAKASAVDKSGWTALHFAVQEWRPEIVRKLINAGAPVDAQDRDGNTPLMRAVFESKGRGDIIRMLLDAGADQTRTNKSGVSADKLARTISNYDVAKYLS